MFKNHDDGISKSLIGSAVVNYLERKSSKCVEKVFLSAAYNEAEKTIRFPFHPQKQKQARIKFLTAVGAIGLLNAKEKHYLRICAGDPECVFCEDHASEYRVSELDFYHDPDHDDSIDIEG